MENWNFLFPNLNMWKKNPSSRTPHFQFWDQNCLIQSIFNRASLLSYDEDREKGGDANLLLYCLCLVPNKLELVNFLLEMLRSYKKLY